MLTSLTRELKLFSTLKSARLVLVSALAITLLGSFFLKRPCTVLPWGGTEKNEYRTLCYNDIEALYGVRHLNEKAFPYVKEKSYEYPVVIGLTMWTASLFADNFAQFFLANLPFLIAAALLTLLGLMGAVGAKPRVLLFAAGPPLFLYAFHNWDLLAVAPLALAMWAWSERRDTLAGVGLGVGAAAKLFPGFIVPSLMIAGFASRDRDSSGAWKKVLLGAVGAYLALNLPIIVADWFVNNKIDGWVNIFAFHSRRLPDYGTPWHWLPENFVNHGWAWRLVPGLMTAAGAIAAVLFTRKYIDRADERGVAFVGGALTLYSVFFMSLSTVDHGPNSVDYKNLVDGASFLLFALGTAGILLCQWRRKRDPWCAGGAIVALFMAVAKVHSPQYALWLLPFFVVLPTPAWLIAAYYATDFLLLSGNWFWIAYSNNMEPNAWQTLYYVCIYLRAALLGLLILWYTLKAPDLVSERRKAGLGKQLA